MVKGTDPKLNSAIESELIITWPHSKAVLDVSLKISVIMTLCYNDLFCYNDFGVVLFMSCHWHILPSADSHNGVPVWSLTCCLLAPGLDWHQSGNYVTGAKLVEVADIIYSNVDMDWCGGFTWVKMLLDSGCKWLYLSLSLCVLCGFLLVCASICLCLSFIVLFSCPLCLCLSACASVFVCLSSVCPLLCLSLWLCMFVFVCLCL